MGETIKLELADLVKRFEAVSQNVPAAVYSAFLLSAEAMVADVTKNRMTGQYLGVVTGGARRSIQPVTTAGAEGMKTGIESHLNYVKAHEEGFRGEVQVPEHLRKNVSLKIDVRTGKVTKRSAREYKAAVLAHRKLTSHVRAHSMKMNIRAKYFMRDTVRAAVDPTASRVERALVILASTGRIPTPAEINRGGPSA
jgi:hypothetical protein